MTSFGHRMAADSSPNVRSASTMATAATRESWGAWPGGTGGRRTTDMSRLSPSLSSPGRRVLDEVGPGQLAFEERDLLACLFYFLAETGALGGEVHHAREVHVHIDARGDNVGGLGRPLRIGSDRHPRLGEGANERGGGHA